MRLRPIILAILFVAGFYYVTTHRPRPFTPAEWLGRPAKVEITEAAGPEGPGDAE